MGGTQTRGGGRAWESMNPTALTCILLVGQGSLPEGLDPCATSWRLRNSLDKGGSSPWLGAQPVLMPWHKEERGWCFGEMLVWGG